MSILEALRDLGPPIVCYPELSRCLKSNAASTLVSQLSYWTGKGRHGDWVYKRLPELQHELALSRRELDGARRLLKRLGILEERYIGMPPILYFRLNGQQLQEAFDAYRQGCGAYEADEAVCTKRTNAFAQNGRTSTETTRPELTKPKTTKRLLSDTPVLGLKESRRNPAGAGSRGLPSPAAQAQDHGEASKPAGEQTDGQGEDDTKTQAQLEARQRARASQKLGDYLQHLRQGGDPATWQEGGSKGAPSVNPSPAAEPARNAAPAEIGASQSPAAGRTPVLHRQGLDFTGDIQHLIAVLQPVAEQHSKMWSEGLTGTSDFAPDFADVMQDLILPDMARYRQLKRMQDDGVNLFEPVRRFCELRFTCDLRHESYDTDWLAWVTTTTLGIPLCRDRIKQNAERLKEKQVLVSAVRLAVSWGLQPRAYMQWLHKRVKEGSMRQAVSIPGVYSRRLMSKYQQHQLG